MKIKVVFWGKENISQVGSIKALASEGQAHYYKKCADYLLEYVSVKKVDKNILYKEVKGKIPVILVTQHLAQEDVQVIKELEQCCEKLSILIQEEGQEVTYLPVFLETYQQMLEKHLETKDYMLLMGSEKQGEHTGKLVYKLFENWQYMMHYSHIALSLFSPREMMLNKLVEIEDVLKEYIDEDTKLEVNWYPSKLDDTTTYFLVEGK